MNAKTEKAKAKGRKAKTANAGTARVSKGKSAVAGAPKTASADQMKTASKKKKRELVRDALANEARYRIKPKEPGVLRVGLIGWMQKGKSMTPRPTLESFEKALSDAFGSDPPDVVLCAGARVRLSRKTKLMKGSGATVVSRVAPDVFKAARCPVLFEAPDDEDESRWLLATKSHLELIRHAQNVSGDATDAGRYGFYTLAEWSAGLGTIAVEHADGDVTLVLAICNEVRMFTVVCAPRRSVVEIALRGGEAPAVFKKRWILLHPAHRSYMNSQQCGVAIVRPVTKSETPLLERIVAAQEIGDGTVPPMAAIHVNNYFGIDSIDVNRRNAFLSFGGGGLEEPTTREFKIGGRRVTCATVSIGLA